MRAGRDLSLGEVETVASGVAGICHPEAHLIVGASTDPAISGRLEVTVILADRASQDTSLGPSARSLPVAGKHLRAGAA